jgi:chromate transport protein ChrA
MATGVLVVLRLFWSFARVGGLAWGGGPSMIPLMPQEVLAQQWLSAAAVGSLVYR